MNDEFNNIPTTPEDNTQAVSENGNISEITAATPEAAESPAENTEPTAEQSVEKTVAPAETPVNAPVSPAETPAEAPIPTVKAEPVQPYKQCT